LRFRGHRFAHARRGLRETQSDAKQLTRKEATTDGILESAKPAIIICTRDRARATAFYRETLGLTVAHEDSFAAVFNIGGVTLRVSRVADFTPHEHTILGFNVPDVASTVKALRGKGVTFNSYQHVSQDEVGIWTAPGGAVRVAWFKDPDGNVLSVTNA
jgi:catechol 2,3-dioxygenase-like lactoylglutathione lyase family enzyme